MGLGIGIRHYVVRAETEVREGKAETEVREKERAGLLEAELWSEPWAMGQEGQHRTDRMLSLEGKWPQKNRLIYTLYFLKLPFTCVACI